MHISNAEYDRFISGDFDTFEQVFNRYCPSLVSLAMRCSLTQVEAEDVVLEVFHQIWTKRDVIKGPASFNSLITKSVRNKSINVYRDSANQRKIIHDRIMPNIDEAELHDVLVEQEVVNILHDMIGRLPKRCEEVTLLELSGHSYAEIADILGITESSVRTYKARSITILRELMAKCGDPLTIIILGIILKHLSEGR